MAKLDALRAKYPRSFVALLRIQGVGPKALRKLRAELGVESIDDLRAALATQKVRGLAGFGAKSEEKLAEALARHEAQGTVGRTPISVALPLARRIVARDARGAGRLARRLLRVAAALRGDDRGRRHRGRGLGSGSGDGGARLAEASSRACSDAAIRRRASSRTAGRRSTCASSRPRQLGAALLYFTGSKGHNIKLRQRALARGLTLNEYALAEQEGGRVVASETEEQIYAALGLPWIPPVLREDAGEIDAAERGALPEPIGAITGDFHVHTSLSGDGRSTLAEVVDAALARGCRVLAITDHAENTLSGVKREALLEQRAEIRAMQERLGDRLRLLHGVELNIGKDGELDYDDEFRRSFDWCLASVHDHFEQDRVAQTRRIVKAMADPSVRMIGHLSARMIGGRPPIDLDLDAIFEAAELTGTALEVNGALPRLDLSAEALRRARERSVTFVLTSDAHHARELDRVENAARNAERAWVGPDRIANAWPADRLREWAERRSGDGPR